MEIPNPKSKIPRRTSTNRMPFSFNKNLHTLRCSTGKGGDPPSARPGSCLTPAPCAGRSKMGILAEPLDPPTRDIFPKVKMKSIKQAGNLRLSFGTKTFWGP